MTHRDSQPEQDTELSQLLSQLRADTDVADGAGEAEFSASLHRRLVAAGSPAPVGVVQQLTGWLRDRPWAMGTLCGTAAGVAAFALMHATLSPTGSSRDAGSSDLVAVAPVSDELAHAAPQRAVECEPAAEAHAEVFIVPAGQVAMVQLNFAVETDVDEAEFSVLLPAGLAFFSEGEALPERAFHWVAPLTAGDNEVPVAIVGQDPGLHRVTATATIDGEVVVHEVVLEVREAV
jgi:hypothetical protein